MNALFNVKPLAWDEITQARTDEDPHRETVGWEAPSGFSSYYIVHITGGGACLTFPDYEERDYDSPTSAKEAAQADYAYRILSAIEVSE